MNTNEQNANKQVHNTGRIALLVAATLTVSLAATAASAHPNHGRDVIDRSYGHAYGHVHAPYRSKHMPQRLHHNKRVRHWYRHSAVRHNPYLPWWKVYRIYERQMALRHYRYGRYGGHRERWRRSGDHRRYDDYDDYYDDWDDDDRPRRRKRS